MDSGKHFGSSLSSSTFRDMVAKSSQSPSTLFGSFGPPNTVPRMLDASSSDIRRAYLNAKHGLADRTTPNINKVKTEETPAPKQTCPLPPISDYMRRMDDDAFNTSWWQGSYNY